MELTLKNIDNALKSDKFWLYYDSTEACIIAQAERERYIVRLRHTQAQWTEDGLLRARIELWDSNELDGLEKAAEGERAVSIGCNSNGHETPIIVRLTKENNKKYICTNDGLRLEMLDFGDCFKDTPANRKAVRKYCNRRRDEWKSAVIKQLESTGKTNPVDQLKAIVNQNKKP